MYTPLKFSQQVELCLRLYDAPSREIEVNRQFREIIAGYLKDSCDAMIIFWVKVFTVDTVLREDEDINRIKSVGKQYMRDVTNQLGITRMSLEDVSFFSLVTATKLLWDKYKQAYLLERELGYSLVNMNLATAIPCSAVIKLPARCLYIDYCQSPIFGEHVYGTFAVMSHYEEDYYFTFTHVIGNGGTLAFIAQNMKFSCDDLNLSVDCIDLENADMGATTLDLDNGIRIEWNDEKFAKFFINFCLYLHASNKDVEYTERTKSAYKPRKENAEPKNKISEVEEYGVGFRYARTIGNTRKVYLGKNDSSPETKRSVSSHYRSAHWHHYWVNDAESPNGKSLVLKWVEGTFIHGNKENDAVTVHKVVKGNKNI